MLEGYYGGSHQAFLDGWMAHSRQEWTLLTLPAYKWKWRMLHGAITFADEVRKRLKAGDSWDVLFCSDMLNLAEFRGLLPDLHIPAVVYFHENQLTYPLAPGETMDLQFGFTDITTALCADRVLFNSRFQHDQFFRQLPAFISRMPEFKPRWAVDAISVMAWTAWSRSLRSMMALPPRRRFREMLGSPRPSSRLATYFG